MSLLYLEDNFRFDEQPKKSNRVNKERNHWSNSPNAPRIPSNLVKSSNQSAYSASSKFDPINSEMLIYDRQKLLEFLNERENNLFKTRDEYEEQFENFFTLAKRFHTEKLNNLKLTFKNQILKQQIYFETELLELSKECIRDYECKNDSKNFNNRRMFSSKKQSTKSDKFEKQKQLVRLCKSDMKTLLDYMREAVLNSSDTLIEAYETCHILKTLETIENNFQKQNSQMKLTTSNLLRNSDNALDNDQPSRFGEIKNKSNDSELTELNKQLNEEQVLFNNYKQEMDELMHTLDDIELQHLQRKDQLTTKTKFFNKLKTKFKFIETKYDRLNKQISNLKYESYIFKRLWVEKQHTSSRIQNNNENLECNLYTKSSVLSSLSTALSTSSSSRSSSTSSLSDCVGDLASSNNEMTSESSSKSSTKSSSSSSSSSLSNQDISELLTASDNLDFEELVEENIFESDIKNECDEFSNISLTDYNRKLYLINELINLHKSKMSPKDLWKMSSETPASPQPALNNFTKANIKYFNLKDEEEKNFLKLYGNSSLCINEMEQLSSAVEQNLVLFNVKQESCFELADVSTDGDRVRIANCNLKEDHDISNWYITRQIDDMPIRSYKFPSGSVIFAGKSLKIDTPFVNDQLDYLSAIKNQQCSKSDYHSSDLKKLFLKIRTKLIAPDGNVKAMHTQAIPQFYQEIFKYANLIRFIY